MQPKIIVSKNREDRGQKIWQILEGFKITSDNLDILVFEDEKIGIAQIKQLIKHLSTKPFGQTPKSVVILNGNNISPDAQNALLKTLEEPPGESIILIGIDAENKLLPTVLSRCQVIDLPPSLASHLKGVNVNIDIEKLFDATIEEKFEIIEKSSDREKLLSDFIESYRQKALSGNAASEFLEELLQAQIWKESNVNIRTILEYLMLKLKST